MNTLEATSIRIGSRYGDTKVGMGILSKKNACGGKGIGISGDKVSGRAFGSALCFYASPEPGEKHTDGLVASETIKLLEQNKDKPFFIAAGFYKPHCPYISPKKYFDMYPPEKLKTYLMIPGEMEIAPPWAYFIKPIWRLNISRRFKSLIGCRLKIISVIALIKCFKSLLGLF